MNILAFLAGAGVLGVGILIGASIVQSSFDKTQTNNDD